MDDSKPIQREHDRAIRVAITSLEAAQQRAIEASQRLSVERDRYGQPWSVWFRVNDLLFWRCSWIDKLRDGIVLGCVATIPTFALFVIIRVALEAWNAR